VLFACRYKKLLQPATLIWGTVSSRKASALAAIPDLPRWPSPDWLRANPDRTDPSTNPRAAPAAAIPAATVAVISTAAAPAVAACACITATAASSGMSAATVFAFNLNDLGGSRRLKSEISWEGTRAYC